MSRCFKLIARRQHTSKLCALFGTVYASKHVSNLLSRCFELIVRRQVAESTALFSTVSISMIGHNINSVALSYI